MKPVDQTIVSKGKGDCMRACIASLLELPIEAVPNFLCYGKEWCVVMINFLDMLGYEFWGAGTLKRNSISDYHIKGHVMASVKSKNFKDTTHAVIMNLDGLVVHDPSPKKQFQDVNIIDSKELICWDMIRKTDKRTKRDVPKETNKNYVVCKCLYPGDIIMYIETDPLKAQKKCKTEDYYFCEVSFGKSIPRQIENTQLYFPKRKNHKQFDFSNE